MYIYCKKKICVFPYFEFSTLHLWNQYPNLKKKYLMCNMQCARQTFTIYQPSCELKESEKSWREDSNAERIFLIRVSVTATSGTCLDKRAKNVYVHCTRKWFILYIMPRMQFDYSFRIRKSFSMLLHFIRFCCCCCCI